MSDAGTLPISLKKTMEWVPSETLQRHGIHADMESPKPTIPSQKQGASVKKSVVAILLVCSGWAANGADVNVVVGNAGIGEPGVSITFGSRDSRGYYWDGREYRDPDYWRKHNGPKGEKYYTGRGKGNGGCPPGQAKKAKC